MHKKNGIYIGTNKIKILGVIELLSIIILLLFDFSIFKLIILSIVNIMIFLFTIHYTNNQMNKLSKTKTNLNDLINYLAITFTGFSIIVYSYFLFPKFYLLGGVFFAVPLTYLLLKYFKNGKSKGIIVNSRLYFYGSITVFTIPVLLDLHYAIVPIPSNVYYPTILIYTLGCLVPVFFMFTEK